MIADLILCLLAACGVLMVLWCLTGWALFPCRGRHDTLIYLSGEAPAMEQTVRAQRWLRKSGLSRGRVILVDCGMTRQAAARAQRLCRTGQEIYCREDALCGLLKTE